MLRVFAVTALLGLVSPSRPSVSSPTRVTPVSWRDQASPAFLVECSNDSGQARSLVAYVRNLSSF